MVLLTSARVDASPITNLADFFEATKNCNQLGHSTIEFTFANKTLVVSADSNPKGYCLLTVKHPTVPAGEANIENSSTSSAPATTTPDLPQLIDYTCPLSKENVAKLSNPEVIARAEDFVNNPDKKMTPELQADLSVVTKCVNERFPTIVLPPQIIKVPPVGAVPAGAVPAGTLLPLPPGVLAAPGTVPPGTPPGMIPTSANPITVTVPAITIRPAHIYQPKVTVP